MDIKLVVAKGKTAVKEIPLLDGTTIIGRRNDCGLRIPSPLVSRQHCELVRSADGLSVKDLGSSNGTFVNGSKVKQKELKTGDTLGVGPITFIVRLGEAAGAGVDHDDEEADFVVAEDVVSSDEADFEVSQEGDADADFVVAEPVETRPQVVVASDASDTEDAADFVVAEEVQGETVHDLEVNRVRGRAAVKATQEAEVTEAAPEASQEKPAKKAGLFGRLFGRKEKKAKSEEAAAEPPTKGAKKKKAQPAPAPEPAKQEPAASEAAEFFVEEEPAAAGKPVAEDELADFLMGLNEKEQ